MPGEPQRPCLSHQNARLIDLHEDIIMAQRDFLRFESKRKCQACTLVARRTKLLGVVPSKSGERDKACTSSLNYHSLLLVSTIILRYITSYTCIYMISFIISVITSFILYCIFPLPSASHPAEAPPRHLLDCPSLGHQGQEPRSSLEFHLLPFSACNINIGIQNTNIIQ